MVQENETGTAPEAPSEEESAENKEMLAVVSTMSHLDMGMLLLKQHKAIIQIVKQVQRNNEQLPIMGNSLIRLEGHAYSLIRVLLDNKIVSWVDIRTAAEALGEPELPLHKFFGLTPEEYVGNVEEQSPPTTTMPQEVVSDA